MHVLGMCLYRLMYINDGVTHTSSLLLSLVVALLWPSDQGLTLCEPKHEKI